MEDSKSNYRKAIEKRYPKGQLAMINNAKPVKVNGINCIELDVKALEALGYEKVYDHLENNHGPLGFCDCRKLCIEYDVSYVDTFYCRTSPNITEFWINTNGTPFKDEPLLP